MVDFAALRAPFPADEIEWRVGSTTQDKTKGMALAYIDARAVMDRLDDVCGPERWQCRYPIANGKTCCEIGIDCENLETNPERWVWKADGAGDTDIEASKGAFSDSFKRAAVRWGIGRYLYELPAPWVKLVPAGRSYKIDPNEMGGLFKILKPNASFTGPLGLTELKGKMRELAADIPKASDIDELEGVRAGYAAELFQARFYLDDWYAGAIAAITKRKDELRNV